MRLPEIKLMTDEELNAEIERLKQRVLDAKDVFRTVNDEAFEVSRKYTKLRARVNTLRFEWLGVCEAVKILRDNPGKHHTGLLMLKAKTEREYRDARLESLRTLKEGRELLSGASQAHKEYTLLMAKCEYLELIRRRRETAHRWENADSRVREILSDYALELEDQIYRKGDKLARLREDLS